LCFSSVTAFIDTYRPRILKNVYGRVYLGEGERDENRMRLPSAMIVGVEVILHVYFY
jgi:hypothetical protein